MRVIRIQEKNGIRLYSRVRGQEKWIPLYFAYDMKKEQEIKSFKTITQARKYMATV